VLATKPGEELGDWHQALGLGGKAEGKAVALLMLEELLLVAEQALEGHRRDIVDSSPLSESRKVAEVAPAVLDGRTGVVVHLHPVDVVVDLSVDGRHVVSPSDGRYESLRTPASTAERPVKVVPQIEPPPVPPGPPATCIPGASRIERRRSGHLRCSRSAPMTGSPLDRYYDPSSDEFLSIDPLVAETGQPYAFTGDDPLNTTDPLGQDGVDFDPAENGGGALFPDNEEMLMEHGGAAELQDEPFDAAVTEEAELEESELLKSGDRPDKNGRTRAGYEYQKHMGRGEFPRVPSTELDNTDRQLLSRILTSSDRIYMPVESGRFAGGFRVYIPGGPGAVFDANQQFQYFGKY
jgi:hypothetical protein